MLIKTPSEDTITYNPATNAFEALVTIHTQGTATSYPCAIDGHLTMPLATAAFKLTQQAKQRHKAQDDLHTKHLGPFDAAPLGLPHAA